MPRPRDRQTPEARATVNERVEQKIKRASELPQQARILLYGRSNTRKTRTGATAPNVLLIDVNEEGTDSVRHDLDPHVIRVYFWTEIQDIFWYLQSGEHSYLSFCLDGLTSMQALCRKFVLGDEASRDASRDPDMPTTAVHQKVAELMRTQITNFRNLPMNAVFTALEQTKDTGEDELEERPYTSPMISNAVAGAAEAAVGMIGYMTNREVVLKDAKGNKRRVKRNRMYLGDSERYLTKDRYGLGVEHFDAPNLTAIIEQIYRRGNSA